MLLRVTPVLPQHPPRLSAWNTDACTVHSEQLHFMNRNSVRWMCLKKECLGPGT